MHLTKVMERTVVHGVLIVATVLAMLPMLWIIVAAFQPNERLFQYPPNWFPSWYTENSLPCSRAPICRSGC